MEKIWSLRLWKNSGIGIRKQPPGVIEIGAVAATDDDNGLGFTIYLIKYAFDFGSFWYDHG